MFSLLYKLTRSSSNPQELSATVHGLLVAIIPLLIIFTGLSTEDINVFIDTVTDLVLVFSSGYALSVTLYGLARKVYNGKWSASE